MHILFQLLTGAAVPLLLLLCGGFFLIYLRGRPLLCPRQMLSALTARPRSGGISPFRALTLALAGTLGVGNIVGVANALLIGGPGALLWMWVSALLAMILKYAEILLAVRHRRTSPDGSHYGGAIYYIRDLFASRRLATLGAAVSAVFALFMILNSLTMGCIIQVNAVSSAFAGVFDIPPLLSGLVLLVLALPVVFRGAKGSSALTEYLIPILSGGYLLLSLAVLILRREMLPSALSSVFSSALSPRGAAGGVLGFLTSSALRVGTMRGLLSNEAGCGTAPTAHACADTDDPARQGIFGILEVFIDTVLLCTATALVILVSFPDPTGLPMDAVMLAIRSYSAVLGGWSDCFFALSLLAFAYATVICQANYGSESLRALTPKKPAVTAFLLLFLACIPLGALLSPTVIWTLSDIAIATLTEINLAVLLLYRKEIRQGTPGMRGMRGTRGTRGRGLLGTLFIKGPRRRASPRKASSNLLI